MVRTKTTQTKAEKQAIARQAEIATLATQAQERPQSQRGGSAMLVPASDPAKQGYGIYPVDGIAHYRVDMNELYQAIACTCPATTKCKHREAAELAVQPILEALLDDATNPIYRFGRDGMFVLARVSQLSSLEKAELRQQKRAERLERKRREAQEAERAAARAAYIALFDPCMLAC